jgi:septum formation protein
MTKNPSILILASASPRRRELLSTLSVPFEVMPANVEEFEDPDAEPSSMVVYNSALKADFLSKQYPERPVLAADTTVYLGQRVLNKPADMAEARHMLKSLSGCCHEVYTGVAIRWLARDISSNHVVQSRVCFKRLDEATIEAYFKIVNPLDKAGAYGIQEGKELIIDHFEGSFTNIMGLPMELVSELMDQMGLINS